MDNRAEELITQLEAEIVKRDARIVELEAESAEWSPLMQRLGDENQSLRAELAVLKAQQPGGVVLPDDRELLDFAVSEQFLLFCDEEEFLDIAKSVLSKFGRLNPCRAQAVPDVLFDGFAVYSALDAKAQGRTSPENVSDTLDAAVRLIRAAAHPPSRRSPAMSEFDSIEEELKFMADCSDDRGDSETSLMFVRYLAHIRKLNAELAALKEAQGEAITEVSAETFSSDGTSDIITCNLPIGTKLYLSAPPASADARLVPAAMPERWEVRLSRMHQTIQAGCWPKRWVDDAKDYELGELRALLARQEVKS